MKKAEKISFGIGIGSLAAELLIAGHIITTDTQNDTGMDIVQTLQGSPQNDGVEVASQRAEHDSDTHLLSGDFERAAGGVTALLAVGGMLTGIAIMDARRRDELAPSPDIR